MISIFHSEGAQDLGVEAHSFCSRAGVRQLKGQFSDGNGMNREFPSVSWGEDCRRTKERNHSAVNIGENDQSAFVLSRAFEDRKERNCLFSKNLGTSSHRREKGGVIKAAQTIVWGDESAALRDLAYALQKRERKLASRGSRTGKRASFGKCTPTSLFVPWAEVQCEKGESSVPDSQDSKIAACAAWRHRMEQNLKIARAQLIVLQRWEVGTRELAVQWSVWMLKMVRRVSQRPRSIQLLLFTAISATIPRISRSLQEVLENGYVFETSSELFRLVEKLIQALDKSRCCFSAVQCEALNERVADCRRLLRRAGPSTPSSHFIEHHSNIKTCSHPVLNREYNSKREMYHNGGASESYSKACYLNSSFGNLVTAVCTRKKSDGAGSSVQSMSVEAQLQSNPTEVIGSPTMERGSVPPVTGVCDNVTLTEDCERDVELTQSIDFLMPATSSSFPRIKSDHSCNGVEEANAAGKSLVVENLLTSTAGHEVEGVHGDSSQFIGCDAEKKVGLDHRKTSVFEDIQGIPLKYFPMKERNHQLSADQVLSYNLLEKEGVSEMVIRALEEKACTSGEERWGTSASNWRLWRGEAYIGSELKVSLLCPLSSKRIQVPVRGSSCTHLDAFDLGSYLRSHEKEEKKKPSPSCWKCPLCGGEGSWPQLRVATFLLRILRSTPENTTAVLVPSQERHSKGRDGSDSPRCFHTTNCQENSEVLRDKNSAWGGAIGLGTVSPWIFSSLGRNSSKPIVHKREIQKSASNFGRLGPEAREKGVSNFSATYALFNKVHKETEENRDKRESRASQEQDKYGKPGVEMDKHGNLMCQKMPTFRSPNHILRKMMASLPYSPYGPHSFVEESPDTNEALKENPSLKRPTNGSQMGPPKYQRGDDTKSTRSVRNLSETAEAGINVDDRYDVSDPCSIYDVDDKNSDMVFVLGIGMEAGTGRCWGPSHWKAVAERAAGGRNIELRENGKALDGGDREQNEYSLAQQPRVRPKARNKQIARRN